MSVTQITCLTPNPGPFRKGRRCKHVDDDGLRCVTLLHTRHKGSVCYAHDPEDQLAQVHHLTKTDELMRAA